MHFGDICKANDVEKWLVKPSHPRTNSQVELMIRTTKEVIVKRFPYANCDSRRRLDEIMAAYHFARWLKLLSDFTL